MFFEEQIEVKTKHCDTANFLRLDALARLLQQVADDHLTPMGLGSDDLRKDGHMWIIVKRYVELTRIPKLGEVLHFTTWTGPTRHGIYPRHFEVKDQEGNLLASVVCQWVVMDSDGRTMISGLDLLDSMPYDTLPGELKMARVPKEFPQWAGKVTRCSVPEDIDENGHVNNSRYITWATDVLKTLNPALAEKPKNFWIEYTREVLPGQAIEFNYILDGETFYLQGTHEGLLNFTIIINIKK